MNKKLAYNITFHNQLEELKFHLDIILQWGCNKTAEFVLTSAHKENLSKIKDYCMTHYPNSRFDYLYITKDYGYHLGTLFNVNEGIKYIKDNKEYDYLVNIEADNMFYDEIKFLNLLSEIENNNKHLLIVDWVARGSYLYTNYSNLPKYHALTTLNIYSKYFIENHYPLEYYEEIINLGWDNNIGTPFEDYLGIAFNKKHSLDTEEKILEYFSKWAYYLNYNILWKKTLNHGECIKNQINNICCDEYLPHYTYFLHALIPDRFVKYGIVLFTKELEITKKFIEYYKPYLNIYEY